MQWNMAGRLPTERLNYALQSYKYAQEFPIKIREYFHMTEVPHRFTARMGSVLAPRTSNIFLISLC